MSGLVTTIGGPDTALTLAETGRKPLQQALCWNPDVIQAIDFQPPAGARMSKDSGDVSFLAASGVHNHLVALAGFEERAKERLRL